MAFPGKHGLACRKEGAGRWPGAHCAMHDNCTYRAFFKAVPEGPFPACARTRGAIRGSSRTVPTCRVAREESSFCGRRGGDDCSTKRGRCSMSADDGGLDRIGTMMIRQRPPETLAVRPQGRWHSSTMGAMYTRACRRATPPGGWNDDPWPERSGSYVS